MIFSSFGTTNTKNVDLSLIHIYEWDADTSAISMRIRQKLKHEASGEASRSHLCTLQNGRWGHFICYCLSNAETKDSKEKGTRSPKEKKNVGSRDL